MPGPIFAVGYGEAQLLTMLWCNMCGATNSTNSSRAVDHELAKQALICLYINGCSILAAPAGPRRQRTSEYQPLGGGFPVGCTTPDLVPNLIGSM